MRFALACFACVIVLLASGYAFAEPKSAYTMTLTAKEWEYIIKVLGKQPYDDVAPMIGSIFAQAKAANIPPEPTPPMSEPPHKD